MKLPLFLFFSFTGTFSAIAQNTNAVKGIVVDTTAHEKLGNATVSVLRAKDSTLVTFKRASKDGSFIVENLASDKYLILICYPGYADYVEAFEWKPPQQPIDFKVIQMTLKAKLLEEVIVKGNRAAIKMNGDTMEFNASRFIIQPNDRVEDLIRQFPGIQIDKEGKITAHGETVTKVLVDGEEFFGDDPTLVTKNIRSDMVSTIQLYDKKSDLAVLTGIDDGISNKTLNVKLKEDKKNGMFGKVIVGVGNSKLYNNQLMFNTFKGRKRFSVFGTTSNISAEGLDFMDKERYGPGGNINIGDGGMVMIMNHGDDEYNSFSGQGLPKLSTAGIHYSNKWNNDKTGFNGNYKLGSSGNAGNTNTLNLNYLPTGVLQTNSDQNFKATSIRQKLDGTYSVIPDSSSKLKILATGSIKKGNSYASNFSSILKDDNILLNENEQTTNSEEVQNTFQFNAAYSKIFRKAGRTISANLNNISRERIVESYLNSNVDFYNATGALDSSSILDQFKKNTTKSNQFSAEIDFSESFSKRWSVWFSYDLGIDQGSADRKSFNASAPRKYDQLDPAFSNNYEIDQVLNQGGAIFNYKTNKTSTSFGTKAGHVNFIQNDINKGTTMKRDFINWTPQVSYKYTPSEMTTLKLSYDGSTTQPSIDQIQPIIENTDPLNLYIGNPLLKPSFRNSFGINYNTRKVIKSRSIYASAAYSFISNQIVQTTYTDTTGKSISQAINIADKNPANFQMFFSYSFKLTTSGIQMSVGAQTSGNKSYNYINEYLNTNNSYRISANLGIYTYKPIYSASLSFAPGYNISKSSLQKELNDNGQNTTISARFSVLIPGGIKIEGDGSYEYRAKTKTFNQDFSQFILNAKINKSFLKDKSMSLILSGNDLLNDRSQFQRYSTSQYIIQRKSTILQRYFMLSLTYDFNRMGGASPKK